MSYVEGLHGFLRESLRIEGIHREATPLEISATRAFLAAPALSVTRVSALVAVYAPHARLRNRPGMDVTVGDHVPMPGGAGVKSALAQLLGQINDGVLDSWAGHVAYETLHPYTDGNGRSGRAIWLWQHRDASLGFLHRFYYQTLASVGR